MWCPRWAPRTDDLCDTDMGAMKAAGRARMEHCTNPAYKYHGLLHARYREGAQGASGQRGLHGGGHPERTPRRGLTLFLRMCAALYLGCRSAPMGSALACCLVLCCWIAMRCPLTPGNSTGQGSSPLLMLMLCICQCPQIMVG